MEDESRRGKPEETPSEPKQGKGAIYKQLRFNPAAATLLEGMGLAYIEDQAAGLDTAGKRLVGEAANGRAIRLLSDLGLVSVECPLVMEQTLAPATMSKLYGQHVKTSYVWRRERMTMTLTPFGREILNDMFAYQRKQSLEQLIEQKRSEVSHTLSSDTPPPPPCPD
jgi:hypothetical protein